MPNFTYLSGDPLNPGTSRYEPQGYLTTRIENRLKDLLKTKGDFAAKGEASCSGVIHHIIADGNTIHCKVFHPMFPFDGDCPIVSGERVAFTLVQQNYYNRMVDVQSIKFEEEYEVVLPRKSDFKDVTGALALAYNHTKSTLDKSRDLVMGIVKLALNLDGDE